MKFLQKIFSKWFSQKDSHAYKVVNSFIALTTIVSILAIVLETVAFFNKYDLIFNYIEYISVGIFSLEYMARIIAAKKPAHYIFGFWGAIDLLSILPTYLGLGNLTFLKSARLFRILRFLRVLRIMKVARTESGAVLKGKRHDHAQALYRLNIEIYFFTLFSAIVIFGSLIFVFESHQVHLANIPLGMLWAAKVLLGGTPQIPPTTIPGEIVTVFTRFTGLMLFGLLITVVGGTLKRTLFGSSDLDPEFTQEHKK